MWKIKIWTRKFPSFIKGVKVNLNGKNNKILRSRTSKFVDTIITVCGVLVRTVACAGCEY